MPATCPWYPDRARTVVIFASPISPRRLSPNVNFSLSRRWPMASNFSNPKPIGSISLWQPAHVAGGMHRQPVAIGHRFGLGHRRQVGVDPRRRIGHVLAEKLLAHKQPARRRRRLIGLGGQRGTSPGPSSPARSDPAGRHPFEIGGRRLHSINARQVGVHVAIIGGEELHEIAIFPDQIGDEPARLLGHGKLRSPGVNCGNARRSLVAVSTRSKRSHCETNSSSAWRAGSSSMRRAAFCTPSGVSSSPRPARGEQRLVRHAVPERSRRAGWRQRRASISDSPCLPGGTGSWAIAASPPSPAARRGENRVAFWKSAS